MASIKAIHVYDFDNTLFSSPLPNPQLWHPACLGLLQAWEVFAQGGWWHNVDILASTGGGVDIEEPRGWKGWWNESVVELAENSISDKEVVTVLLTGRGESNFADLINRMCNARQLDFDMIVLKPEVGPAGQQFPSTLDFKQSYLRDLVLTYHNANTLKIYEDRVKHVKAFRDFFDRMTKSLSTFSQAGASPERGPLQADVIHVCELKSSLDPQAETTAIQKAVNYHNRVIKTGGHNRTHAPSKYFQVKEQFLYFGYLISEQDAARLISLCNTPAHLIDSGEVKYVASSILIAPFYPRKDLVDKVGGRGNKVIWRVNGIAKFEDRIWAARVEPVGDVQTHTQDETPMVVLAIRKGSRQIDAQRIKNWQPIKPEKQFEFETVVGDKVMLKIEEVDGSVVNRDGELKQQRHGRNNNPTNKRKFGQPNGTSQHDDKENHLRGAEAGRDGGSWMPVVPDGIETCTANDAGSTPRMPNRNSTRAKPHYPNNNNHNNKRTSSSQFNNNNNPSLNPSAGPPAHPAAHNIRARGGPPTKPRGQKGGLPGYKSLDDHNGSGSYEAGNESAGGAPNTSANMVMNY